MLSLARVVAIHPESHAVDLEFMEDGRRIAGVQVMARSAGTNFGLSDLSTPDGDGFGGSNSGTRDVYAVVGWVREHPFVLGFMFPQVAQCLFSDKDRMVYRHSSDVYMTVDANGNTELYHPSGTYLRIGSSSGHEDLTGKDYDKLWKIARNTQSAVHVHLSVKNAGSEVASLNIDPSGNVTESNVGNLSAAVGGNLSANVGGTADVVSGGNMSLTAPTITLNGTTIINGSLTQGKGSNGGACSMNGPVTVTNDVIAGGVSLINHVHSGVLAGGANTGKPV
jgi:hypothetical protein